MAKIKVLNLDNVKRETRFKILKEIRDPVLMNEIGETVKLDIRTGPELAKLKDSTIKQRRYLEQFNATHSEYRPARSNVTFTGELLEALEIRVNTIKGLIVLGFKKGTHKAYRTGKTRKRSKSGGGKQPTYEQLAQWLQEGTANMKARPFMVLRDNVIKDITIRVKEHLKKKLK